MSELKATTVYDAYWKANSVGEGTGVLVYLKSEADKVIAELKAQVNGLHNRANLWHYNAQNEHNAAVAVRMENAKLKAKITEKDKEIEVQKRLRDMALASVPNVLKVMKIIQHHKYKRCLAMARWCDSEANYWYDSSKVQQCWRYGHYISWFNKWSKLADQFTDKEAK